MHINIIKQNVQLIAYTPEPEKLIEHAGRICYRSMDKITDTSHGDFIQRLINLGHLSVLEHASATFFITCDRGISHELVRHRLASFSQESTRYCNYAKDKFASTIDIIADTPSEDITCLQPAIDTYEQLINKGVSPQYARDFLPTCLATRLYMTANFREWLHIIKLRTSTGAHPRIQSLINDIWDYLRELAPHVF
ncbi:MAG: FAD-dependent thymidylate synthase [Candidatus Saccharimonadales bacterium]